MKLYTTFLFLATMLLLGAAGSKNAGKLKSMSMDKWMGGAVTYTYDDEGRRVRQSTGNKQETIYKYDGQIITAKTNGSLITMYLNSRGLVDSLTDVDSNRRTTITHQEGMPDNEMTSFGATKVISYSGNYTLALDEIAGVTTHSIIRFSKKFTYDEAGYLKEIKVYLSNGRQIVCTNVVDKGNIISYSVSYPIDTILMYNKRKNKMDTSIVRQGDFTVRNSFDAATLNSLAIDPFFGKSSKNLMVRSVKYSLMPGLPADSSVTAFKYIYDTHGRVSTLITKVQTNDPPEEKIYSEKPDTCTYTYY